MYTLQTSQIDEVYTQYQLHFCRWLTDILHIDHLLDERTFLLVQKEFFSAHLHLYTNDDLRFQRIRKHPTVLFFRNLDLNVPLTLHKCEKPSIPRLGNRWFFCLLRRCPKPRCTQNVFCQRSPSGCGCAILGIALSYRRPLWPKQIFLAFPWKTNYNCP